MQRFRTVLVATFVIAAAFAAGYIPKAMETRRTQRSLAAAELDLRLANLHRQLGVASHEAQRNNYATAAETARAFFQGCREVAQENDFEERPRTRLALQAYGGSGDLIVGELMNADPVSKERLASLFLTMNGVIERRQ